MNGYGWCVLRARQPSDARSLEPDPDRRDEEAERADGVLWADFRTWMETSGDPFIVWTLCERNNNDRGVLTFSVSRNHRSSAVWAMLAWIASHGPGSYGLFYVHDDEDVVRTPGKGRPTGDHSNSFRVHRLVHGVLTEMDDPFFGEIWPTLGD